MPLVWSGPPDPADPAYRHLGRVVNLALHAAFYAAVNSGLWVIQGLRHPFGHLPLLSLGWAALLLVHVVVVVSRRPPVSSPSS